MKKRYSLLVIGTVIMALGVTLAVKGGYGCDPLSMVWEGLTIRFPLSLGIANLIVSSIFIVMTLFVDKKQISIGTIINPLVMSISTDLFMQIIRPFSIEGLQMMQSILGVFIMAIGVGIYTSSDLGKGAYDAIVFGTAHRFNKKLFFVRSLFDLLSLVIGLTMNAHFGIATIMAVLFVGKIIQFSNEFMIKRIFCEVDRINMKLD